MELNHAFRLWGSYKRKGRCTKLCEVPLRNGPGKRKLRWPCGNLYTQDRHKCTFIHTQCTHKRVSGMGCIGWDAPAAEAPGRVRRSGTLPTICKRERRHVQQVPPATIFMKLLTAAFGFHQDWQWEPQPPISLETYLQCWPFRNPRGAPPPPPTHIIKTSVQACWCVNKIPYLPGGGSNGDLIYCILSYFVLAEVKISYIQYLVQFLVFSADDWRNKISHLCKIISSKLKTKGKTR